VGNNEGLPVLTNRAKQQAMEDNNTPSKINMKEQNQMSSEKRGLSQSPSQSLLQTVETP
jgi:hypothetical protein